MSDNNEQDLNEQDLNEQVPDGDIEEAIEGYRKLIVLAAMQQERYDGESLIKGLVNFDVPKRLAELLIYEILRFRGHESFITLRSVKLALIYGILSAIIGGLSVGSLLIVTDNKGVLGFFSPFLVGLLCGYTIWVFSGHKVGPIIQTIGIVSSMIGVFIAEHIYFYYSVRVGLVMLDDTANNLPIFSMNFLRAFMTKGYSIISMWNIFGFLWAIFLPYWILRIKKHEDEYHNYEWDFRRRVEDPKEFRRIVLSYFDKDNK